MELDDAFKMAVKKFYEGSSHQNVDKYSKTPFEFDFNNLDKIQKGFKRPIEEPVEEPVVDALGEE